MRNAAFAAAILLFLGAVAGWFWMQTVDERGQWSVRHSGIAWNETYVVNATWEELEGLRLADEFRQAARDGRWVVLTESEIGRLQALLGPRATGGRDWRVVSVEGTQFLIELSRD